MVCERPSMSSHKESKKLTPKSLSCLNHLKHGSTSKTLFLKDENPEEYFALLENFFEQYQPAFDHDAALVARAVHDHWILLRRERTVDHYEAKLHERKPDPTYWIAPDLHEMQLFDRYRTEAARAATRSLKNLQTIQKMARDEQHWQQQLESEKQKLAIHVERWQLLKKQQQRASAAADVAESFAEESPELQVDEPGPNIAQAVFVAVEKGVTEIFDIVPSNAQVERLIAAAASQSPQPPTQITRTYIFAGRIPPEYEWLITQDWERTAEDQEIRKSLSLHDWRKLAATEIK